MPTTTQSSSQVKTGNPLGYKPISHLLAGFAIPSIVAMVISSLYNIVDQIFIGNGVGHIGNAATNVSYPLVTICMAISLLIGIGSASRYSLSLGAGEIDQAKSIIGNGIAMMLALGITYTVIAELALPSMMTAFGANDIIMPYALDYSRIIVLGMPFLIITSGMSSIIRADGSPRYSMICMIIGAVLNTILDPIFIFVFEMGMKGAAWATLIGQLCSCVAALLYIPRFKQIKLRISDIRLRLRECRQTAALGMSNSLNQVALTFVQIVLNNSMTYYGAMSVYGEEIPLSACGIVMKTNAIILSVIIGISHGSQPIVGFNYGARRYDRVQKVYFLAIKCNLVISAIGFCLFQFMPHTIISIFGSGDALYFEFAVRLMRTFLFMILLNGCQLISANFFAALGKPLKGLVLSMTRQVLFFIPLVLILPLFFKLDGILYAAPVADLCSFIVTVILVSRQLKQLRAAERNAHAQLS